MFPSYVFFILPLAPSPLPLSLLLVSLPLSGRPCGRTVGEGRVSDHGGTGTVGGGRKNCLWSLVLAKVKQKIVSGDTF